MNGYVTNRMLVDELKNTLQSVTAHTVALRNKGLIVPSGKADSTGGKPSTIYVLNNEYVYSLGLDITAHHVTIGLTDFSCKLIESKRIRLNFEYSQEYFEKVALEVEVFLRLNKQYAPINKYVGVSIPGIVRKKMVVRSHILKIEFCDFTPLELALGREILLINDSNAGALSEVFASRQRDFIYLSLSRTVGSGIIANGMIFPGVGFRSGEIGHVTLIPHGRTCYCGREGCVDPYLNEESLLGSEFKNLSEFFSYVNADAKAQALAKAQAQAAEGAIEGSTDLSKLNVPGYADDSHSSPFTHEGSLTLESWAQNKKHRAMALAKDETAAEVNTVKAKASSPVNVEPHSEALAAPSKDNTSVVSPISLSSSMDFLKFSKTADEYKQKLATQRFTKYVDYLVMLINNINMTFDVPVVLGGSTGPHLAPYLDEIRAKVSAVDMFEDEIKIVCGAIKQYPACNGAGFLCVTKTIEDLQQQEQD